MASETPLPPASLAGDALSPIEEVAKRSLTEPQRRPPPPPLTLEDASNSTVPPQPYSDSAPPMDAFHTTKREGEASISQTLGQAPDKDPSRAGGREQGEVDREDEDETEDSPPVYTVQPGDTLAGVSLK